MSASIKIKSTKLSALLTLLCAASAVMTACEPEPLDEEEINCRAAAVCGPDQEEVESCEGLENCSSSSICGNEIFCVDSEVTDPEGGTEPIGGDEVNCTAAAVCGPDQEEVESCEGLENCSSSSICGTEVFCVGAEITEPEGGAEPEGGSEPEGGVEPEGGAEPEEPLGGGEVDCLAQPVCDEDQREVESCEGQDPCESRELCGVEIFCADA